ncbi:serine/threonine-protein kinase [Bogoriella caseilytica]|uniref:non-specific serine/threonine protein kinase n=1 Tax=Bogoriella caseilytica TaxID=56055 RepID=A0A3N2BFJ2_9MICO|nr:serine/threonine-protein kinase [Bogoriella caseilytica]ROR74019.1 protein kinase-like protein [Bogoriella caseilytica]
MSERLGRYRLEEVIGVGSFATVHRAVDEALLDTVVIKMLAENHSLNPEIRERFIAEGRSLRKVASPHVVGVHDIGENERHQPYLVLEHADRGTLAARVGALRQQGWVASPADALALARQLAAAIAAVHRANLVHRDLSPGNLLLTAVPEADQWGGSSGRVASAVVGFDERLVVADLGMCKDLALNSGLTVGGGTAGFRPPEQDGPGVVDTRADLWAMSALLLWLCSPSGAEHGLPESFFAAVRRSYAAEPEERHPDVAAWLAEIEGAIAGTGIAASSPGGPGLPPPAGDPRSQAGTMLLPEAGGGPAIADQAPVQPGDGTPIVGPPADPSGGSRARSWRLARGAVAVLVAALLGLGAGWWIASSGAPSAAGGAQIAVSGPETAEVGEPVSFEALADGVDSWVWSLPTGAFEADAERVTLTASSPGMAEVVLRARAPDGTDLEVRHRFVVEP